MDEPTRERVVDHGWAQSLAQTIVANGLQQPGTVNLAAAYLEDHAEVERLRGEVAAAKKLLAIIHRDGGQHTASVGFTASCSDAAEVRHSLVSEVERLREALGRAERERDIAQARNDMACENPCGDCSGCTTANETGGDPRALLTKGENDDAG